MLYIVATPIGNSEDLSLRAIDTLKNVDLIACEDTRTSSKLLQKYGITTPKTSLHLHNEHKKADVLITLIQSGKTVAVITDAGTPGISDPGFLIVNKARKAHIPLTVLPGADAVTTALILSGFPSDRYCFEGFLPHKKGRLSRMESWINEERTIIVYESVHRIIKFLEQAEQALGSDRLCAVCREMTKQFEEVIRGTIKDVKERCQAHTHLKGEFVIVIAKAGYTE